MVLVILFAITQTGGPWLCCWVREPWAVGTVPLPPEARPRPPSVGNCPHCTRELLPTPSAPVEKRKAPLTPDQCPCCVARALIVVAAKPDPAPTADGLLVPLTDELPVSLAFVSLAPVAHPGLRELPHLTTSDRLFAHHVLRC